MREEKMYCPTCGSPWPCSVSEGGVPKALRNLPLYAEHQPLVARWAEIESRWRSQCPGVDIEREIEKAHNWEVDNPSKRPANKVTFLTNWMHRTRDRVAAGKEKATAGKEKKKKQQAVDGHRVMLLRRVQGYDGAVLEGEEITSCGVRRSNGIVPWDKVPTAVLEALALQVELLP